jgi:hypothetical protein
MIMYRFEETLPQNSDAGVWQLQLFLLQEAEARLGPMDPSKKIYQPTFQNDGPRIINTPNFDGAFASLSMNAAVYWPTTLYELAHETIHLLNPIAGYSNYLEEGLAVAFSVEMSRTKTTHAMQPNDIYYATAWKLVLQLPGDPYVAGAKIRGSCGSLGNAESDSIKSLFPEIREGLAEELCKECNFT